MPHVPSHDLPTKNRSCQRSNSRCSRFELKGRRRWKTKLWNFGTSQAPRFSFDKRTDVQKVWYLSSTNPSTSYLQTALIHPWHLYPARPCQLPWRGSTKARACALEALKTRHEWHFGKNYGEKSTCCLLLSIFYRKKAGLHPLPSRFLFLESVFWYDMCVAWCMAWANESAKQSLLFWCTLPQTKMSPTRLCHPKMKLSESTCPTITVICLSFGRKYHHFDIEGASVASHVSNDHCTVDDRMLVHLMVAWLVNYLHWPHLLVITW